MKKGTQNSMCKLQTGSDANLPDLLYGKGPSVSLSMGDNNDAAKKMSMDAQTLNKLQGLSSQAFEKRFIFFDQCGGKNKMYLHPSLLKDLSCDTAFKEILNHNDQNQNFNLSALCRENVSYDLHSVAEMISLKEPYSGDSEEASLVYKQTMPSAFAGVNEMCKNRGSSRFLEGSQSSLDSSIPVIGIKECTSKESHDISQFTRSYNFTNSLLSDDLEALLSSDDEASTGQSPGDNTWESEIEGQAHECEKVCEEDYGKKTESNLQGVDGGSTLVSFAVDESEDESKDHCPFNEHANMSDPSLLRATPSTKFRHFSEKATSRSCSQQIRLPSSFSSGFGSSSSAIKRKHSVTSLPFLSGPARKLRSQQMKQNVQLLRSIIPSCSDHMDAAFVFDEAIQYIMSLQRKVQVLEESRILEPDKQE